jgi:hydrogenase-4 component B
VLIRSVSLSLGLALQALGMACLGVVGAIALFAERRIGAGFTSDVTPRLGVDAMSGAFIAILAVVAVPVLLFAAGYLRGAPAARTVAGLTAAFQIALVGVLAARDPSTLLGFWELMTVVPALTILVARSGARVRRVVYEYLAITHVGGAGVWIAVLVLADHGALGSPGGLASAGSGIQALVAIASIVGFGTKAGLMPMHVWLPRAHPVAPTHVSALMSGVMIKVAMYGLIRALFEWIGPAPLWVGVVVLAIGGLSAVGGVVYALFQHELKRLLAFHSIENVGIIALALGAALVLADRGREELAAIAFAAAILHCLNHAVFKALLFLGAGAFERAAGTLEIDRLGGLLRRLPWTAGAFLVGAAAIAGLPPLNGFASEWLTLQSLTRVGGESAVGVALAGALALAALAATAGLALLCFAKVAGLVLLGPPRTPGAAAAREAPGTMRAATVLLAAWCVMLGVAPGLLIPSFAGIVGDGEHPLHAGISVPGTSLRTLGIVLTLSIVLGVLVAARGRRSAAPAPVWACGQPVEPALLWTSSGFTKTLRLSFATVLRPERVVEVVEADGVVREVRHRARVPHLFDALYSPIVRAALASAALARRLQSGSLRLYVAYLAGLVLLMLMLTRAGALG